jgi:sugar lactone lactonase YvrE
MRAFARHEVARRSALTQTALGEMTAWDVQCKVGESPCWHPAEQSLYWIDVRAPQVLRLHPASSVLTRWDLPDIVGAMTLTETGDLWLAMRHGLACMTPVTGYFREIVLVESSSPQNRLNDGKTSPSGRWFVFGSMDDRPDKQPTGALYRASGDGTVVQLADQLTVANGIAWSVDASKVYFSDSFTGKLFCAKWNETTGEMGTPSLLRSFTDDEGRPDGGCVDAENQYWSAGVSAGKINRVDPSGHIAQSFNVPCRAPTMCEFGGPNLDTLFITSLIRPTWTTRGTADGSLLGVKTSFVGQDSRRLLTGC